MAILFRSMTATLLLCVVVAGCAQGSKLKVVPVTGKVTFNDQPLADASVAFMQEAPAGAKIYTAIGRTDAQGMYKLVTMDGTKPIDGAVPGKYMVTVTKVAPSQGGAGAAFAGLSQAEIQEKMKTMSPTEMANQTKGVPTAGAEGQSEASKALEGVSEIPTKYGNPKESGLTADVQSSGPPQTFDFPLTKGE